MALVSWPQAVGLLVAILTLVLVGWGVARARRRQRRRTIAVIGALPDDAPSVSGVVAEEAQAALAAAPKVIVVTGCDSNHYDLVLDLLTSLTDAGREGLTVGFVHVGDGRAPSEIDAAADLVAHVADDKDPAEKRRGYLLSYLAVKARLPELFPGFDVYVWLDGDTWVQNRVGVDQVIQCAQLADLCAHPELDPNYFRVKLPSSRLLELYGAHYGADEAARHVRLPMFNSGVFAARADSPLWALWREALGEVHRRAATAPGLYFSDQVPLHRLIATGRVSVHPLNAVNNWLVHAATPSVNLTRKRLLTPNYPHDEINIVHLTGSTKDKEYRLGASERGISLRYRSIRALFAP